MKEKIKRLYENSSLASKIRYSYMILLVPISLLMIFSFYNMWKSNQEYKDMLNSVGVASEFSLDFKKDFDYEAYLLIVENKSIDESKLQDMLEEARRIVTGLEAYTDSEENINRLKSVSRYLENLETYKDRIIVNLRIGNRYEANLEIWENDIQIVTTLFRETVFQYIYYEIQEIEQTRQEQQTNFTTMVIGLTIAFIVIGMIIAVISYYIPKSITQPIKKLSEVTDQVAKGNLTVHSDIKVGAEVGMLNESLNVMIDKIHDLVEQVKVEQIRLRKAEFEILQAQINPHFLYNTLDAIVWLAEAGDQKKVVSMVESLSDFFRTSLNQGKDIITIEEELQHVRSYLEIQQVRYQDILEYEISVPEELNRYLIPKITIQPLVENALYHGIKNKRGLGKIVISGHMKNDYFILRIEDDGIGMTEERLAKVCDRIYHKAPGENDIYGLYNVNERIRLNFGEKYGIFITSTHTVGTVVNVHLPYNELKNIEVDISET